METLKGHFIVPTAKNPDRGLYFIFHHESDGILAFDVTTQHAEIPFRYFEPLVEGGVTKSPAEKIVLLGGSEQSDTAMLVLHDAPVQGDESHIIDRNFAFLSYRFVLIPGRPPTIEKSDETPGRLSLPQSADFLIVMGFRLWSMDALEAELKDWQWNFIPASPDIVFHTPPGQRLQRALNLLN